MTSQHSDFARGTDPGSRSPAELEREVRESRADVERTLDAIQERLSPGQLVDQVAHYMRDNGGEFARNLGDTVRQNPVPVVLVGVGLAWMMLGSRRDVDLPRAADFVPDYPPDPDDPSAPESWAVYERGSATAWDDDAEGEIEGASAYGPAEAGAYGAAEFDAGIGERAWDAAAGAGEGLSEAARRAKAGLSDARERTREGLREAGEGVRQTVGGAKERLGRFARGARDQAAGMGAGVARGAQRTGAHARRYGERAREGFLETLHRQPLVLGAVGLAIGAAIGAALPSSRREDELMGDTSDQFKQRARSARREEYAKAKATASAAYAAAEEGAAEQGLSREGLNAAAEAARQKVESVADAATEAAKREADRQGLGAPDPIA
jgi:Protein of unknown function (DUF3618)